MKRVGEHIPHSKHWEHHAFNQGLHQMIQATAVYVPQLLASPNASLILSCYCVRIFFFFWWWWWWWWWWGGGFRGKKLKSGKNLKASHVWSKLNDSAYSYFSSDVRKYEEKLLIIFFMIQYFGLLISLLSECALSRFLLWLLPYLHFSFDTVFWILT